ncbi:DUF7827 domain-containing protein [Halobellus limi]|uniref:DUF7827 domain-containing protein n=1 Tax=Halobellus limi TaxID=699433 RepID=A0A4D6H3J3_9EURY|nr:BGTF surface domain-containing protein [Halobellus limi]QCC48355.1 hypothetical protein DV707_12170 [Halobellus limi]
MTVGGVDVTDRYTLDADGSTDGQVVLSSETPVDPRSSVTVGIDAVNDSIDTETIEPGSVDVTVASATVSEDEGSVNAYEGSVLAFVATDGSADTDQAFEVEDGDGTFVFSGRTGAGSQVFAFDTAARNWSGEYEIETHLEDGSMDRELGVTLRELAVSVGVDDRNVTTADAVEGEISANAAGRVVEVALHSVDDGDVIERTNLTLGGNGGATFDFAPATVSAAGPGNYTVAVTDAGTGSTNESARIRVVDAGERTASFGSPTVEEHAGDVVEFVVDLRYADTATLTIGSPEDGFRANVTVDDGNGDGTVRVRFNTAAAVGATTLPSDGGAVFGVGVADGGDDSGDAVVSADIDDEHALTASIDPGEYDLAVRSGPDPNGTAEQRGTLLVGAAAPRGLTNWVAPAGSALSTRGDVSEAVESGRLTRATTIAAGDVVIHRLILPGLGGEFARRSGTATETFFALAGTDADALYALNVTQRTASSNDDGARYGLDESDAEVVADPANDTYVIAYESGDEAGLRAGDSLSVSFVAAENGTYDGLDAEERTLTSDYELVEAAIATADDPVVVANATNQSIAGTTNVAPGTELELRIRSVNGTDPRFLKTTRVVVEAQGRWSAEVDFDAQRVGDRFTVASAVEVVAAVDEFLVDGVVRALVPSRVELTPTTTATPGIAGGGGQRADSASGGGSSASDEDESVATSQTATPEESGDSAESVVDSTRRFLGGVLGTFVDGSEEETLRSRLLGFDVLVSLGALTTVALFVSRRE